MPSIAADSSRVNPERSLSLARNSGHLQTSGHSLYALAGSPFLSMGTTAPPDEHERGFFAPDSLFESGRAARMEPTAFAVYMFLLKCSNRRGEVRVSVRTIARNIGRAHDAVDAAITKLEELGEITCQRQQGCPHEITLLHKAKCPPKREKDAAQDAPGRAKPAGGSGAAPPQPNGKPVGYPTENQLGTVPQPNGKPVGLPNGFSAEPNWFSATYHNHNHENGNGKDHSMGARAPARVREEPLARPMATPAAVAAGGMDVGGVGFEIPSEEIEATMRALREIGVSEGMLRPLATWDAEAPERCRAWIDYARRDPSVTKPGGLVSAFVRKGDKRGNRWPEGYIREADRAEHEAREAAARVAKQQARQQHEAKRQEEAQREAAVQAHEQGQQQSTSAELDTRFSALSEAEQRAVDAAILGDRRHEFLRSRLLDPNRRELPGVQAELTHLRREYLLSGATPPPAPEEALPEAAVELPAVAPAVRRDPLARSSMTPAASCLLPGLPPEGRAELERRLAAAQAEKASAVEEPPHVRATSALLERLRSGVLTPEALRDQEGRVRAELGQGVSDEYWPVVVQTARARFRDAGTRSGVGTGQ